MYQKFTEKLSLLKNSELRESDGRYVEDGFGVVVMNYEDYRG